MATRDFNLSYQNKKENYIAVVLIILSVFFVYYHTLENFLTFDYIRWIKAGIYISTDIRNFFKPLYGWDLYRPFPAVIIFLEYKLFGLQPFYYNLINLFFHILNSCLTYCFIILLFKNIYNKKIKVFAFLSSFLFAISFVHFEPITDISNLNDLLVYFFFILSFIFSIKNKNIFSYIISILFYFLGLLSKESMITFPAVLFLTHIFLLKSSVKDSIKIITPYILISLFYLIGFYFITQGLKTLRINLDFEYSIGLHCIVALGKYLLGLIFSCIGLGELTFINFLYFSVIISILIFFIKLNIAELNKKIIFYFLIWIIIAFLPYIFFKHPLYNKILFGHRFLYIPSFGFFCLLSYIISLEIKEKYNFKSFRYFLFIFFVLFVIISNISTIIKSQIALKKERKKAEVLLEKVIYTINLYPYKKNLLILNFPGIHGLIYQGDICDFIYLSRIKNLKCGFMTKEELKGIILKHKCIQNIDNIIFVEYENYNFLDRTRYYYKLLSCPP